MSKHYIEAVYLLSVLHREKPFMQSDDNALLTGAIVAQAEATLALAEQQRIANLIALYVGDSDKHPAMGDFAKASYDELAGKEAQETLRLP